MRGPASAILHLDVQHANHRLSRSIQRVWRSSRTTGRPVHGHRRVRPHSKRSIDNKTPTVGRRIMMSFTSNSSEEAPSPSVRAVNNQVADRLLSAPPAAQRERRTVLRVLQTTGRRTGSLRHTPVGILSYQDESYLVCPDRTRDWAQNLLADPRCQIMAGDVQVRWTTVPVEGDKAVEAVEAYLSTVEVPWARAAFGLADDAVREQIGRAGPDGGVRSSRRRW